MNKLFNIEKKVTIITGGAGILGSSIAEYLADNGAIPVILDRIEQPCKELVKKINDKGQEAFYLVTDVLDKRILEKNREDIIAKYGRIDVLINAAGGNMPGATIPPDKTIFDLDIEQFKKVVDLNLIGTVLPSMVFSKAMTDGKQGNIINFASETALRPLTRVVGYGSAKAAVVNFTKYLAAELAKKFEGEYRVNAVAPGFFITNQNRALLTNEDGSYSERAKTILAHTPFNRFGDSDELHGSIHYLMSEASKFVTGTVLVIDGGFDAFSI